MIPILILALLIYFLCVTFPLIIKMRMLNKKIRNQEKRIATLNNKIKSTNKTVHNLSKFNELLLEEIKEQEKTNNCHNDK